MIERRGGMPTTLHQKETEAGAGGGICPEIQSHPLFEGIANRSLPTTMENLNALDGLGQGVSHAAIKLRYESLRRPTPTQTVSRPLGLSSNMGSLEHRHDLGQK